MMTLWWIVHKDMITEFRARCVWPIMALLGLVVALVFGLQLDLLPQQKQRLVGGLMWLAIFFAGMTAIDRSFASEREEGCWDGLRLYPISSTTVYLAKLIANTIALGVLQCLLIPLFFLLADLTLERYLPHMVLIAVLGNMGICAVGTLMSALAGCVGRMGHLLAVLVLPLVVPVVLAAAESTRLLIEGQVDDVWWGWAQLLGAFACVFIGAGTILFEFAIEE